MIRVRALVRRRSANPVFYEAGEHRVYAVHVVAGAARVAEPTGRLRVHDHRVADLDVGHRGANLLDPSCVLVTQDVR